MAKFKQKSDFKFKPNKGIWKRMRLSSSSRVDHYLIFAKVRFGWWIVSKRERRGKKGSDCWSWVIDRQWLWFYWGVKVDSILGVWRYQRWNDAKMMLEKVLEHSNKVVENWVWDRVIFLGFIVTVKCGTFEV